MAEMTLSLQREHRFPGAGAGAERCLAAGNIIAPRSTPGAGRSADLAKRWLSLIQPQRMKVCRAQSRWRRGAWRLRN